MSVVECPKCALRFEPEAVTPRVFCPQCGEYFQPAVQAAAVRDVGLQAAAASAGSSHA